MFTVIALNVTHIDITRRGYSTWKVDAVVKVNMHELLMYAI